MCAKHDYLVRRAVPWVVRCVVIVLVPNRTIVLGRLFRFEIMVRWQFIG